MREPSTKRYSKKQTININNTYAIMVDKTFNPKIAQLTINNILPRTALFWVVMQASSGNFLQTFRETLSVPSLRGHRRR
jgi:hypothetical protein